MALNAGDIAFTGFTADDPDAFTFVALVDIAAGEQITFTDNGWLAGGGFRPGEGTFTFTAATTIAAGTVVTPALGGGVDFDPSGDQILAYQGSDSDPSFLAAIQFDDSGFGDATSDSTTALPSALTEGVTALNLGEAENGRYDGPTAGTRDELLTAINDPANWTTSETPLDPAAPTGFDVEAEPVFVESFEEAPGDTYTLSNTFDDGLFDFFGRFAVPDDTNVVRDDFQTGFDGDFAILGQDHDGTGLAATQTITIPDIDISALTDPAMTILLGALDNEPEFQNYQAADNDGIEIFATVDGGARTQIASFAPPADGTGDLREDPDFDGVGTGQTLTTALSEFAFDIPDAGSLLTLEIELTSTASFETLAVDRVVVGEADDLLPPPVNLPPVAEDDVAAVGEDDGATDLTALLLANDSDPEGQPLTITAIDAEGATGLVTLVDGVVTYDPNGQFESLAEGETVIDGFAYTITDDLGQTARAAATVTITGVNDAPIAVDDAVTVGEDDGATDLTAALLANDSDPEGSPLTIVSIDDDSTTGLVALVDGVLTYDPNGQFEDLAEGETATDTFAYTIADDLGATSTATVTVTITGVDDAPVAVDDAVTVGEDDGATDLTALLLANDSDPEGSPLTIVSVDTDNTTGLVALADGVLTYDPNGQFEGLAAGETVTDTFVYTIADDVGQTASATVTVTITGANDAPVAVDDVVSTSLIEPLTVAPLDNDSDVDGDPLTITEINGVPVSPGDTVDLPLGATVTLNADGTLDYDQLGRLANVDDPTQDLSQRFEYTVSDGQGGTDTAFVRITLEGLDVEPTTHGTRNDDVLIGDSGRDLIFARGGDDVAFGGAGRDTIFGGEGDDQLFGGRDADVLEGGGGTDSLFGGIGADTIVASRDGSLVDGGLGDDALFGNFGADLFVFNDGEDVISLFDPDEDQIDLTAFDTDVDTVLANADENRLGTTLNLGDGDELTILGVDIADLAQDDVLLV